MVARSIGVLKQINAQIVAVLKSDTEVLAQIQDSFHTLIRARAKDGLQPIEITGFYEELPLPGVGVVSRARYIAVFLHSNGPPRSSYRTRLSSLATFLSAYEVTT